LAGIKQAEGEKKAGKKARKKEFKNIAQKKYHTGGVEPDTKGGGIEQTAIRKLGKAKHKKKKHRL